MVSYKNGYDNTKEGESMRFQEQIEGITQIQPKHDSTRRIAYQSHGRPMQAWEHGFGKIDDTDFCPLYHLDI